MHRASWPMSRSSTSSLSVQVRRADLLKTRRAPELDGPLSAHRPSTGDAAVADGIASRTFRMLLTNHSRRRTRSRCSSRRRVGRVLLFEAEQKAGLRPINTATLHPTSHHSPFCHTNFETEPPSPTRRSRASEPFEAVMGIHSSSFQFKSSSAGGAQ